MANPLSAVWRYPLATINNLRAIFSHHGLVCLNADREQHQAGFEGNERFIGLTQFKADDLERYLAQGAKLEA
jgi:hypothetical protein